MWSLARRAHLAGRHPSKALRARKGMPTRWMHIHDESEGGAAIVVDADLWDRVWHGDLIGIRADSQSTPSLRGCAWRPP